MLGCWIVGAGRKHTCSRITETQLPQRTVENGGGGDGESGVRQRGVNGESDKEANCKCRINREARRNAGSETNRCRKGNDEGDVEGENDACSNEGGEGGRGIEG